MKIKVVIASAVIAFSSQAHAATDTSCNPFARGENCNGAVSVGMSMSSSFRDFLSNRSRGQVVSFAAQIAERGGNDQLSRAMRRLLGSIDGSGSGVNNAVLTEDETDFDGPEVIKVGETTDVGDDVAVVPVPAAGFLLLVGLGGLVVLRRKKS